MSFEIVAPWSSATREPGYVEDDSNDTVQTIIILLLLASAVLLARSNLRSGRADRRGAYRLAAALFFIYVAFWLLSPHVSGLGEETNRLFVFLGLGLFVGGVMYLVYLAIEPFVRRSWPTMLVGWSRALAGRLPDPLIGRDVVVGVTCGLLITAIEQLRAWAPELLHWQEPVSPMTPSTGAFEHTRFLLLLIPNALNGGLQNALLGVMMFTGFRELIKRALSRFKGRWVSVDYLAAGLALMLVVLVSLIETQTDARHLLLHGVMQFISTGVFLLVLLRFGLLATVVMYTINTLSMRTPLTLRSESLYAGPAWVMLGVIFAIALAGFWMARRGESPANYNRSTP